MSGAELPWLAELPAAPDCPVSPLCCGFAGAALGGGAAGAAGADTGKNVSTGCPGVAAGGGAVVPTTRAPPPAMKMAMKIAIAMNPLRKETVVHPRPAIEWQIGHGYAPNPWDQGDACSLPRLALEDWVPKSPSTVGA